MNQYKTIAFREKRLSPWRKLSLAVVSATLLMGGISPQLWATPAPLQISQRQSTWDAALRMARLVDNRQTTALVLQLDILEKPVTTYANAVYQVYAWQNGRWREIYTNTGARLVTNANGRTTLAPEVIPVRELQQRLGSTANLDTLQLRSVVQLRYDLQGGQRNQMVEWELAQNYQAIAQSTTTQIASLATVQTSSAQGTGSTQVSSSASRPSTTAATQPSLAPLPVTRPGTPNNVQNPNRGHFSLAVMQSRVTLPEVIARVSIKSQRPNAYLQERLVGDFRYQMNQRARFIRGLNPGDRVVVRLFDLQNRFLGYSEFELLDDNASVNLVLSDNPFQDGLVRTVYGIDTNQDFSIDRGVQVYDYFTRVTTVNQSSYTNAQVTFLNVTQSINLTAFSVSSLPTPSQTGLYPVSFSQGAFSVVNQTLRAFSSRLATALISAPGQVVQIINFNSSRSVSVFEVSRLILTYQEVGFTEGTITTTCDLGCVGTDRNTNDDEYTRNNRRDRQNSRRNCNQGIGNGAEGCDPGNSRPHGGSNDESGRTPGRRP